MSRNTTETPRQTVGPAGVDFAIIVTAILSTYALVGFFLSLTASADVMRSYGGHSWLATMVAVAVAGTWHLIRERRTRRG